MQNTEQLEKEYEAAHSELNQLYNKFHDIPGYIREKTGEELALQAAKKVFGRFNPNDLDLMESNTNNGNGFTVNLDDGTELHLSNQLELYNKVVSFNKSKGGFCDENFIKHNNIDNFNLLTNLKFRVEITKDALVDAFPKNKLGYEKAREIETRSNKMSRASSDNQKGSSSNDTASNNNSSNGVNGGMSMPVPLPLMRTPLLSSIPNTFRQAKALFNDSRKGQQSADTNVSSYVSDNERNTSGMLEAQLDANLTTAKDINKALIEPVNGNTEQQINKLSNDLINGNKAIDKIVNKSADIENDSLDSYSTKIKKEMDEMKERAAKHPLEGVRRLIGNVIKQTLETLKNMFNNIKSLFCSNVSPASSD
ncbi:MAG: hypothetical protein ACI87J_002113 [Colwellia sp.]|jgi:hypothetical protein